MPPGAARVERGLNELDGVQATVNFAVERAHVEHTAEVSEQDLIDAVAAAGYQAAVVGGAHGAHDAGGHQHPEAPEGSLRSRLIVSAVLAAPVIAVSMIPAWQSTGWQWLVLALTTPIVFWGGYPFHSAAVRAARHRSSTMDTLVSLGTLAAYFWSVYEVVLASVVSGSTHFHGHLYFETAAAVTLFLLAGRFAESRAKRQAGAALRELLALGAKDAVVLRDGAEVQVPVSELRVDEVFVVRPGERIATDGVVVEGASALDTWR